MKTSTEVDREGSREAAAIVRLASVSDPAAGAHPGVDAPRDAAATAPAEIGRAHV